MQKNNLEEAVVTFTASYELDIFVLILYARLYSGWTPRRPVSHWKMEEFRQTFFAREQQKLNLPSIFQQYLFYTERQVGKLQVLILKDQSVGAKLNRLERSLCMR